MLAECYLVTQKRTRAFFHIFFDNLFSVLRKRGMLMAYTKLFEIKKAASPLGLHRLLCNNI